MIKNIFFIFIFLITLFLPVSFVFAEENNIGFVSQNIWYSKDDPKEGDKIKIYTFIFNPDSREFSGTVSFFDKTTLLGKKEFSIPAKKATDISIDWTVTLGDHLIFGKIENPKFLISKDKYEEIYLENDETEKNKLSISVSSKENEENSIVANSPFKEDIKETIEKYVPLSIRDPISNTITTVEDYRENVNESSLEKKDLIKKEITDYDKKEDTSKNVVYKPLKYLELFLFSLAQFIFNSKIIFYGLIIFFVFFIFRFLIGKFL